MAAKLIIHTLVWYGVTGAVLFLSAGTLDWPSAWLFLGVMVLLSLVGGLWLARRDPGLVEERLGSPLQKEQAPADRIVLSLILLGFFVWLVVIGLDAKRFGWSSVPFWVQVVGALGTGLSVWIGYRTMIDNSFAAPVVKIQKDRGQRVINTGLYAIVRHPMYAGALLFFAGMPLLLGSWWGLGCAALLVALLIVRIHVEEAALRAGLQGYDEYAQRVRYRLIPGVW